MSYNFFPLDRAGVEDALLSKWQEWFNEGYVTPNGRRSFEIMKEYVTDELDYLCAAHNMSVVVRAKILKNVLKQMEQWIYDFYVEQYFRVRAMSLTQVLELLEEDMPFRTQRESITMNLRQWVNIWRQPGRVQALAPLAALAGDKQNVHTEAVNEQTNTNIALLMATAVRAGQRTLDDILNVWCDATYVAKKDLGKVYEDMKSWGSKKSVIDEDDYMYRKLLRCAWAKIVASPPALRTELEKRLYEECQEAVGMCAQGHLSRIANVFVGFDDNYKAEVSSKEAFQNAIAALATSDTEDKIGVAKKLFVEYGIVEDEQQAWLDAF